MDTKLDGCGKFLKYSIFLVNITIFLFGIAIVGLGIWAIVDGASLTKVLDDKTFSNSAAILLTFGGVVAFISFLGCCGAIKEVKCLLLMFFIVLFLITICIVVAVVFAFQIKDKVENKLVDGLLESMNNYNSDESTKEAWDNIQTKLKCCGAVGPADWRLNTPQSCHCELSDENKDTCDSMGGTPGDQFWNHGCWEAIREQINKHATPLIGVGIAIMLVIVLAMIFSCALFTML